MSLVDIVLGEHEMKLGPEQGAGVMVGTVSDVKDPLFLGRVRVLVPAIDANDPLPWARIAQPAASMASGMYWIPNKHDEVLVAFEQGDLHAPYVIGCLWSAINVPPLPSPLLGIRLLRSPKGNQILFMEDPATVMVSTKDFDQTILLSPAGIQIVAGTTIISMTKDGITLTGANINLVGTAQVNIAAPKVSVVGTATTTVGGAGPTVVTGKPISIA
jgi:uncharacterized protein involved in type VI secretion and phage assembly